MMLHEKYRPRTFAEVVGQNKAVEVMRRLSEKGWGGRVLWVSGQSGTGKTTLAKIAASEVADKFFIEEIDAVDCTPHYLAELEKTWGAHGWGKGGRAYIVNEAHALRKDAVRKLLVMLERVPSHVLLVFTTTVEGQAEFFDDKDDAGALLSRCIQIRLARRDLSQAFAVRAAEIADKEHLNGSPMSAYARLAKDCGNNMRAMIQEIEAGRLLA